MEAAVEAELNDMLKNSIILHEPDCIYNSPLIVVRKTNNNNNNNNRIRIVHNYIRLNEKTIDQPYTMSNQEEILAKVATAQWATRLDLARAFWQLPILIGSCQSQKLTAFHTNTGAFSYRVLSMGLKNSSWTCYIVFYLDRTNMQNVW